MIRYFIQTSLRARALVLFAAIVVVVIGIHRSSRIPVDVFPEFAPPIVEIQTEAPGLSTEEVDRLV
ncbi:MAG: efflux RND transporter permease subunit, partial [Planctomycetes bacterium]|nr:efflux RND transporter permease subunit [Planctomycetota bacterium]